jgi:hypothetical protein
MDQGTWVPRGIRRCRQHPLGTRPLIAVQRGAEPSHVGGSCLALDRRQAESSRLVAHGGDLPGPEPLAKCLGAQLTTRGAMGEPVIDEACDRVGRGNHRGWGTEASTHAPGEGGREQNA